MHPSTALFESNKLSQALPVCDHYAGSEKLMRKSIALQQQHGPIFDITLDCEDGAPVGQELAHAQLIAQLINSTDNMFNRIGARVHDVHSLFFKQDIRHICTNNKLAYIVIPKARNLTDVIYAIDTIKAHNTQQGLPTPPLHFLIETHGALADVFSIAALPEVECLSFGIMDFISEHNGAIPHAAMHSPLQFTHPLVTRAKLQISAACHQFGKTPSHNVTTDINHIDVVTSDATRAHNEFGYTRMWSIHPNQIIAIINAMSPQHDEIKQAAEIISKAIIANWGPIQHNGILFDRASYRYHWTVLKNAKKCGKILPESVLSLF